jgi:hypothetical protein
LEKFIFSLNDSRNEIITDDELMVLNKVSENLTLKNLRLKTPIESCNSLPKRLFLINYTKKIDILLLLAKVPKI